MINGFDYSKYLKTKKIVASFFAEKINFIKREENIISKIFDIKLEFISIINTNFEKEEAEVLKAILLGEKENINDKTSQIFSKSNLSHILAISGLHITYICLYIEGILRRIINNTKLRNCFMVMFLIIFIILVGGSPSAMRACIMMIITYIGKNLLKEKDFYISFVVSFFIILLINPYNIYSISMWLSFLGSLGIVLFSNFIQKVLVKKFNIKSKIAKKVLEIIVVSSSAQILIFPVMWKNFGTLSFSFWISNLLVSELVAPILILGYISILIFPIRKVIVFVERIILKLFLELVLIASKIPFNQIYLPSPSNFTILVYYLFIFFLITFYKLHKINVLKCILSIKYVKKQIKLHKKIVKSFVIVLIIFICISQVFYFTPKNLRINFLDVRSRG
ncbi:MAG: ComEC/Rec2 family competence protein [Clostridia bacterium]|nr:ComEC/Rec2 family competence protein [Clostridia bacterium]